MPPLCCAGPVLSPSFEYRPPTSCRELVSFTPNLLRMLVAARDKGGSEGGNIHPSPSSVFISFPIYLSTHPPLNLLYFYHLLGSSMLSPPPSPSYTHPTSPSLQPLGKPTERITLRGTAVKNHHPKPIHLSLPAFPKQK